jgi:hypothetical protein|tara:strand:+ start:394 stop:615 length:222 start_codon:yes stop_codon:yes gene_type:complete
MGIPDIKIVSEKVEKYAKGHASSYLDAVVKVAEEEEIDVEIIGKFLSKPIKEKLEIEGRELNLIRSKKPKLPF